LSDLRQIVDQVRAIPFGRNDDKSPAGVVAEGRGTCSTKHALLADLLRGRPELDLRLVHRIYRIDRARARELFGADAAAKVPTQGLVDVHTYATVIVKGRRTVIDVTFPSDEPWDGRSDMPLQCGEGTDVPATDDPWAQKAVLVAEHCEPAVREPFIAALGDVSRAPGRGNSL
jgi:hypothetical protein